MKQFIKNWINQFDKIFGWFFVNGNKVKKWDKKIKEKLEEEQRLTNYHDQHFKKQVNNLR